MFAIGVFTIYLIGTGSRHVYLKLKGEIAESKALDWLLTILMLASGLFLLFLANKSLLAGNMFNIVVGVFGVVRLSEVW